MKVRKLTMNIGIISFIIIFVILCLMTFAILSLSSAKSNADAIEKSIENTNQYYELSSEGEKTLKKIDDYLYQIYQTSSSQTDYFHNIQSLTEVIDQSQITQHLFSYTIQNKQQSLYIELEILYPGSSLYQIKTWKVTPTSEWNMDQSMEIL